MNNADIQEVVGRYAVTVLGLIPASELGFVLPHEHLTVDNRIHHIPSADVSPTGPLSINSLGDVRVWPHAMLTNLVLDDDDAVIDDLVHYRQLGGTTLVELTPKEMGRDLARVAQLSMASGVHVVASTGHYVSKAHGGQIEGRTTAAIAAEYIYDLTEADLRAGAIGEIGMSKEPVADEWRVLEGALSAQAEIGAPIWVHMSTTEPMPQILEYLEGQRRDLSNIVLCHVDYDLRDLTLHRRALELGLTIEFDLFGFQAWNRRNFLHAPSDGQRVESLVRLAERGFGGQLLMSQDVCQKIQLRRFGGFGYGHLIAHCKEAFLRVGGTDPLWDKITRTNPARLLAWVV